MGRAEKREENCVISTQEIGFISSRKMITLLTLAFALSGVNFEEVYFRENYFERVREHEPLRYRVGAVL
jgi:hypothetical protein